MGVDKLASELEVILTRRIEADQLVLPTMPAVALQVQGILDDEEAGMKEVAVALSKDPVLAARVLKMATSAAFASAGKKPTLDAALARLGAKVIKGLLIEVAAQRLFVSRNSKINGQLKGLWEHSVAVGLLARETLTAAGAPDAEAAYLAGLLHDVGKPVVATILLELERQLTDVYQRNWIDSGEWLEVVGRVHKPVGLALAEKWQLPEPIAACIKVAAYQPEEKASAPNAVCFANALAKKAGIYLGRVDEAAESARIDEGVAVLGLPDGAVRQLTEGLRERATGLYE
jgi:putative nucleotidyltransferase with HDIG domain